MQVNTIWIYESINLDHRTIRNSLTPAELAACLSALVFQEKNNEDDLSSDLPQNVLDTCKVMKGVATDLGTVRKNHELNNKDPNEYCDNALKFGLVHVVYEWAMVSTQSNYENKCVVLNLINLLLHQLVQKIRASH
jgi:superfamily II RNA helicase